MTISANETDAGPRIDARAAGAGRGTPPKSVDVRLAGYAALTRGDPVLRRIVASHGRPNPFLWEDGGRTESSNFAALLLHIAGQQISTEVAFVLFDRVRAALGGIPEPESVAALGPERLRAFGLSRAKAEYMTGLAELQMAGTIDVEHLDHLDDAQAIASLTSVRGVGRWSAEMFLIHQLHRPDILPAGDLGIRRAVEAEWAMRELPSIREVDDRARSWAPYRSYAAALLWSSRRPVTPAPPRKMRHE
ncbi:MAG TPA: hypothetical protein VMT88_01355 [Actinomycetes bacterium]|nr:hypothetical protein [Actinomycetes bacterium]